MTIVDSEIFIAAQQGNLQGTEREALLSRVLRPALRVRTAIEEPSCRRYVFELHSHSKILFLHFSRPLPSCILRCI